MLLWITRSAPFNMRTRRGVAAIGHRAITVPVLHIRASGAAAPAREPSAIVFTSPHGVRLHQPRYSWSSLPVFAVGDQTALLARERGYADVRSADGDASDLRDLVIGSVSRFGHVVHFGAREPAGSLVDDLGAADVSAELVVAYESVKATAEQLRPVSAVLGSVEGIVVHSARGAQVAAETIGRTGWYGIVFCLSPACAAPFATLPGLLVETAPRPTEASLLELLRAWRGSALPSNGRTGGHRPSGDAARPVVRLVVSNPPRGAQQAGEAPAEESDDPPPAAA